MSDISLTNRAQKIIQDILQPGDIAVDATAGNGWDTLFLAKTVGAQGYVYSFDIQQEALDNTYTLLKQHDMEKRVSLVHAGHETLPIVLPEHLLIGGVKAIMFNLGYLPGGDKKRTTGISTTLSALNTALQLLTPGGCITIVAYIGHPGGREEAEAVRLFVNELSKDVYNISLEKSGSDNKDAPELIVIRKISCSDAANLEKLSPLPNWGEG